MLITRLTRNLFKKIGRAKIIYLLMLLPITFVFLGYLGIVTYGAAREGTPILLKHKFFAERRLSLCYPDFPDLLILNPWRDRSPEKLAQGILRDASEGRCSEVVSLISSSRHLWPEEDVSMETMVENCDQITKNPPWGWSLVDYSSRENETVLFYQYGLLGRFGCNSRSVRFVLQKNNTQVLIKSLIIL